MVSFADSSVVVSPMSGYTGALIEGVDLAGSSQE